MKHLNSLFVALLATVFAFGAFAGGNELAYKGVDELQALSGAPAAGDLIPIYDTSARKTKRVSAVQVLGSETPAVTATIALAASVTTDGMAITITMKDAAGATVAAAHAIEVWISESAACAGLTADSYSGTVTAGTGAILTAYTAKKHFSVVTHTTGIAVLTAVDSANPADQYVCVKNPWNGRTIISAVSGTNWEGV